MGLDIEDGGLVVGVDIEKVAGCCVCETEGFICAAGDDDWDGGGFR